MSPSKYASSIEPSSTTDREKLSSPYKFSSIEPITKRSDLELDKKYTSYLSQTEPLITLPTQLERRLNSPSKYISTDPNPLKIDNNEIRSRSPYRYDLPTSNLPLSNIHGVRSTPPK